MSIILYFIYSVYIVIKSFLICILNSLISTCSVAEPDVPLFGMLIRLYCTECSVVEPGPDFFARAGAGGKAPGPGCCCLA